MLEIRSLVVAYDGSKALSDVSLQLSGGEFVSVIGSNGAGKTTLFKAISGTVPTVAGKIFFDGHDLLAVPAHRRPHLGIAHVPEGRQVFSRLTVAENLELGATTEAGRKHKNANIELVQQLFPVLRERALQLAGTLSGGQQQMLAIGRGLMAAPHLLLLDEPSMGLAPAVADTIFEAIVSVRQERKMSVLLVEQRAVEALEICDRGYVIESGRVVLEGRYDQLLSDDRVRSAYLGL